MLLLTYEYTTKKKKKKKQGNGPSQNYSFEKSHVVSTYYSFSQSFINIKVQVLLIDIVKN